MDAVAGLRGYLFDVGMLGALPESAIWRHGHNNSCMNRYLLSSLAKNFMSEKPRDNFPCRATTSL